MSFAFIYSSEMLYFSLITLGVIGAFDEAYYHQYIGKILWRKECLRENVLHLVRTFCFSLIFFIFSSFELTGFYVLALVFLFMSDLIVGFLDIVVERNSRAFQGGLYSGEYLTHMLLSFHLGALYINLIPRMLKAFNLDSSINFIIPSSAAQVTLLLFSIGTFIYGVFQTQVLLKNK